MENFVITPMVENAFIGLKDKNKQPIYANSSIVKFKFLEELHTPIELIGVFSFNQEDLRYEIDIYQNSQYVCLSYVGNGRFYDFEIIGTVAENPELIKLI